MRWARPRWATLPHLSERSCASSTTSCRCVLKKVKAILTDGSAWYEDRRQFHCLTVLFHCLNMPDTCPILAIVFSLPVHTRKWTRTHARTRTHTHTHTRARARAHAGRGSAGNACVRLGWRAGPPQHTGGGIRINTALNLVQDCRSLCRSTQVEA